MKLNVRISTTTEATFLRALHREVGSSLYFRESPAQKQPGEFMVGACVMEILDDAKSSKRTVRYVRLDDVALYRCRIKRGRLVIDGPSRRDVSRKATASYSRIIQRSQDLLLSSLYQRLVAIDDVRLAMNPLRTILLMLEKSGAVRSDMFTSARRSPAKVQNYFTLLQDLEIIKRENGDFVPGPVMKRLSLEDSEVDLYSRIIAFVLERRFDYIREVLKWTMMIPFLEWSNAYYFPAYEADTMLRWRDEDYFGHYNRLYRRPRTQAEVVSQTAKVRDAGVVLREGGYWVGDDEIFEEFSKHSDRENLLVS
jgi:hypothetical protein